MNRINQTKKLKIAVLIKRFIGTGGAEKYAVEVTRRLRAMGHCVDLYAMEADDSLLDDINFYRVPKRLTFSSVLNSYSFARESAMMLKGKAYDIIHSHERGFLQDISTVHTFPYIKGSENYSLLKKIDRIYLSPRSRLHIWLEQKQMETLMLVAVSDTIKDDIKKYYCRDQMISVITPGTDIDWFNPRWIKANRKKLRQEAGISDRELVILFVGSEFKRKGLDNLIPAVDVGARLLVVGTGERHRRYQRLADRCGVADRVEFKGLSNNIRNDYAVADVVVLPSLAEAFGMSILEGMACGLPVITSLHTGVSSLIKDGINGFTFHDPAMLPEILRRFSDPKLQKRIGVQARKTAEAHTWDTTSEKFEELCYRIAQKDQRVYP